MTRYFAFVPILLCLCASACASRSSVAGLGERMVFLEREVLAVRTEENALKDELHQLELRVEYLENEALKRGEAVPPRRPGTAAASGAASAPQTEKSVPAPSPAGKSPQTNAAARPESPQSPAPGALPSPLSGAAPQAAASGSTGEAPPETPTSLPPAMLPRLNESTPATPTPAAAPSKTPARPERNAYDAALQLYRTGRYPEAEAAFQAFLEVYPTSRLVPNALYWKGETLYARGRYTDAIFAFKDVQTRFPQDAKTPDSLLKTAMAYQKLGDATNTSLHLTVLFEDWPKAEATQRAQRMGLKP
ncbi:MAG: tol-pal system protein YbgF [Desulfovibrionaceae bacterium]|nr:tol-pal system protein YbgF [Desulfovibrionaceae bacterium]